MRFVSSGARALGKTGGLAMRMTRKHPYAVGGTMAGAGLFAYGRHSANQSYAQIMHLNGPGTNNPAF